MTDPQKVIKDGDALLVIDVQNDFCPGGALPIEKGDKTIPVLNRWMGVARDKKIPVYFSRDWHPIGHISFKGEGGMWPVHCLQDSEGAKFHPELAVVGDEVIVTKGVRFDQDQNSAFDQTGFAEQLRRDGVKRLWIGGLALDVCVLATVLDGLRLGFEVVVVGPATRPVTPEGGEKAIQDMIKAGGEFLTV